MEPERLESFCRERLNAYLVLLLLLFAAGVILRLHNLGGDPLWKTETYNVWAAWNFLQGNGFTDPAGPGMPYTRAWLTTSLPIAISFSLFGFTEFAARFPSVISGMLTVVVGYFLGKDVGGKKMAVMASGLMALDYWMITWNTTARMYSHAALFYLFSVFLLMRWYNQDGLSPRSKYFFILVPTAVLGFHNHLLYISLAPVFAGFVALRLAAQMRLEGKDLGELLTGNGKRYIGLFASLGVLAVIYLVVYGVPVWLYGYTPNWYSFNRGPLFYLSWLEQNTGYMFLASMGTVLAWRSKRNWMVPLAFLVPFAAMSLLFTFKEPRFVFHIYPIYLVTAAFPLVYFLNAVESWMNLEEMERLLGLEARKISAVVTSLLMVSLLVILTSPVTTFSEMSQSSYGLLGEKPNHELPAEYIMERRSEEDIVVSTAPFITAWYMGGPDTVDYNLDPTDNKNISGELVNPRIGIPGVRNGSEMERIIRQNSGWVVADPNFKSKTKTGVRDAIIAHSRAIKKDSWTQVTLYRFR